MMHACFCRNCHAVYAFTPHNHFQLPVPLAWSCTVPHVSWHDVICCLHITLASLSVMRTMQVTVGLSSSLQHKSMDVQADILTRLAGALDRTPDVNLGGLHIMVGEEGYGPDKQGRLWLHADASPALWSQ